MNRLISKHFKDIMLNRFFSFFSVDLIEFEVFDKKNFSSFSVEKHKHFSVLANTQT